jgi:sortase (surface protein transpeptidase)
MELPDTIHQVGWYQFGTRPSDGTGVRVLAVHVDTRGEGLGPFARLRDVRAGASVMLTTTEGDRPAYRVTDVQRIARTAVPFDQLFRREGPETLARITCGGRYDRGLGYRGNVIVTVVPGRL